MQGETLAVLTALSWTIGTFFFTEASRRMGSDPLNHFRLLLAVILLSLALWMFQSTGLTDLFLRPGSGSWFWLGLSGVVGLTIGDWMGFSAYAILGSRRGSLLTTFAPAVAFMMGFFYLGESLNWVGLFGIGITLAGIAAVVLSRAEKKQVQEEGYGKVKTGILLGFGAAVCQGAGLVLSKLGMQASSGAFSPLHASWIRMFAALSALYLFSLLRGKTREVHRQIGQKQHALWFAAGGTIFGPVVGVSLSLYTVSVIHVSVAQTIFSLVPVFVLPVSWIIYRESLSPRSVIASIIAVAGVMVLVWREWIEAILHIA